MTVERSEIINYFLQRGMLISQDFIDAISSGADLEELQEIVKRDNFSGVLGKDVVDYLNTISEDVAGETQQLQLSMPDNLQSSEDHPLSQKSKLEVLHDSSSAVKITQSHNYKNKKKEVSDFVNYFKRRYESLKKILISRQELQDCISIARVSRKQERETVAIIGVVLEKVETKNGNLSLIVEDPTGSFKVLIMKNKEELYNIARDIVLDEVIGLIGVLGKGIIFCNSLYFPDVSINHELKKSPDEAYVVFISDIHFGIKNFLSGDFMNFVLWLKGEYGNEQQRNIASKVKYLFITGDVVEGVGIYPGQEEDLEIKDIYRQYEEATRYLKMIPERIKIIVCGGNHDAMRMSEPQPVFDNSISKGFYEIPNMIQVSNPALVNIHSSDGFPGFEVLMYHGFSFPYYGENVPSIRDKGGLARCDLIMKFLLQRRHLAPSHSSTLYVPDETLDPLVIEKIPDIFVSGHIHQITAGMYRNVSLINSSCWVVQSEDNAKRGIVPHPAKIPIVNLRTREIKIMNFLDDSVKVLVSERLGLK